MKRSDSQIRQLQEENATLLLQLKTERSNSALVQAQNDDNTKHLKGVLEESRNELRKMIASTKSEIDYLSEIITHKNDEILKLQKSNADLTEKLDKVQTELIHFKSRAYEHTQDVQHNVTKSDEPKSQNNQHDLPQVLLIGTSNIDGINEGRLTTAANVTKIIAYRFNDTTKAIRSYTNTPNLVVLHSLTNEIKSKNPETCIKDLEDIIWLIQSKWPAARVVISLATPRNDDIAYHTNVLVVNALLKQKYHDDENIRTVEHTNMFVDGIPNSEMLQDDNYHLNARGTSALAFNIKNAIHSVLNLQLPLRSRFDRSRSRNAFRGRGRGRGYMNQRRGHGRDFP